VVAASRAGLVLPWIVVRWVVGHVVCSASRKELNGVSGYLKGVSWRRVVRLVRLSVVEAW
jgi:hypothetical protein